MLPVKLAPVVVNTATLLVPAMVRLALPLGAKVKLVVPLTTDVGVDAAIPVSADPLPTKNPAAMLPVVLTLPDPNVAPAAVTLPVIDTTEPVWLVAAILPPVMLPPALTAPTTLRVPPLSIRIRSVLVLLNQIWLLLVS